MIALVPLHTGEIWSRKTKKFFYFKKISSVFASASCGNRSREVNSPSLLFGDPPSLASSEKFFQGSSSIWDTQAISKKFLDFSKNSGIGGCGLRTVCPL